jgi:hypothetical protein
MIKLAIPGLLMVEAEFLAFEILTLASSYFSTTHLAAQSVLATITGITFQIPFPMSIAASTRVANLIGATLTDAAKTSAKVASLPNITFNSSLLTLKPGIRHIRSRRSLKCNPSLRSPQIPPPTLHQRRRRNQTCRSCPTHLRRLPTLRRSCRQRKRPPPWSRSSRNWRLREPLLLLCYCHAD